MLFSQKKIDTDESTHSLIIALNDNYEGGGTYFLNDNITIKLKTGQILSFNGNELEHGGEAITKGIRYIIAVFLYHDDTSNNIDYINKDNNINNIINDNINDNECIKNQKKKKVSINDNHNDDDDKNDNIFRQPKQQKLNFSFGFDV